MESSEIASAEVAVDAVESVRDMPEAEDREEDKIAGRSAVADTVKGKDGVVSVTIGNDDVGKGGGGDPA